MSTYVMSDVHGHKLEFDEMLEKINFSDDDELWILGDIIDKGNEGGEMIRWAVDDAPDNVHFLLGNHEDMAYTALKATGGKRYIWGDMPWSYNGGRDTLYQLEKTFDEDIDGTETTKWINEKMLPWIESLPTYKYLEVSGRPFMLVHAGFDPNMFESVPEEDRWGHWIDCNIDPGARNESHDVGHGFGQQDDQHMLWERSKWHTDDADAPVETVFGHTHFKEGLIGDYEDYYGMRISGGMGKIAHFHNKHAIDCGCAYAHSHPRENMLGRYALGCLRLDDMKEFYVKVRDDDHIDYDPW